MDSNLASTLETFIPQLPQLMVRLLDTYEIEVPAHLIEWNGRPTAYATIIGQTGGFSDKGIMDDELKKITRRQFNLMLFDYHDQPFILSTSYQYGIEKTFPWQTDQLEMILTSIKLD